MGRGGGAGVFLVVEGAGGAGKTTLVRWLPPPAPPHRAAGLFGRGARGTPARHARTERVRAVYQAASGPGVVHVDATQSKQAVQEAAWREVMAVSAHSLRGMS